MEEKKSFEFLEDKCNEYLQHLICIGTKLAKKGNFNEEKFSRTFFPKREFVMRKIREQAQGVKKESSLSSSSGFDSKLIEEMRKLCKNFEGDYSNQNNVHADDESPDFMSANSFRSEGKCESPVFAEKATAIKEKTTKTNATECDDSSHILSQELNYGELSKIFVQKSRVDAVCSKMETPDFEDHLETIYVYRTRPRYD